MPDLTKEARSGRGPRGVGRHRKSNRFSIPFIETTGTALLAIAMVFGIAAYYSLPPETSRIVLASDGDDGTDGETGDSTNTDRPSLRDRIKDAVTDVIGSATGGSQANQGTGTNQLPLPVFGDGRNGGTETPGNGNGGNNGNEEETEDANANENEVVTPAPPVNDNGNNGNNGINEDQTNTDNEVGTPAPTGNGNNGNNGNNQNENENTEGSDNEDPATGIATVLNTAVVGQESDGEANRLLGSFRSLVGAKSDGEDDRVLGSFKSLVGVSEEEPVGEQVAATQEPTEGVPFIIDYVDRLLFTGGDDLVWGWDDSDAELVTVVASLLLGPIGANIADNVNPLLFQLMPPELWSPVIRSAMGHEPVTNGVQAVVDFLLSSRAATGDAVEEPVGEQAAATQEPVGEQVAATQEPTEGIPFIIDYVDRLLFTGGDDLVWGWDDSDAELVKVIATLLLGPVIGGFIADNVNPLLFLLMPPGLWSPVIRSAMGHEPVTEGFQEIVEFLLSSGAGNP